MTGAANDCVTCVTNQDTLLPSQHQYIKEKYKLVGALNPSEKHVQYQSQIESFLQGSGWK